MGHGHVDTLCCFLLAYLLQATERDVVAVMRTSRLKARARGWSFRKPWAPKRSDGGVSISLLLLCFFSFLILVDTELIFTGVLFAIL